MTEATPSGLYPPIEPYNRGSIRVSGIHTISFEEMGNRSGRPVVFLHGGPGSGISPKHRRFFDPEAFRVVLVNQRGAGDSHPLGELSENTTRHLIQDLEVVRKHLNIDRWLIFGGSWGSLLALCYAVEHRERVAGLILRGVFLGRREEIAWLHGRHGAATVFPEEWRRYRQASGALTDDDIVASYHRLLIGEDQTAAQKAAPAWLRWQESMFTFSKENFTSNDSAAKEEDTLLISKARIECHYTYHRFFLDYLPDVLEAVHVLEGVPCKIVQGRYDLTCPPRAAWDLAQKLTDAELLLVNDGAHSPYEPGMATGLIRALGSFK
ncbi:prolyl aminopeptidase [Sphingosinicella rhizophila]|uniref:Proline iminopeptidase n=1 Tax=Sphingosinicella rhizophila TaxID=3050082 RepID=A0ABU3Q8N3_9SPHN|nr:prolyl aminopeptidase [Sphingosinicella sp. GR2756]MDT9599768.1 prolyl aminopeptidase [Sphingosinicella sp. GR2756]